MLQTLDEPADLVITTAAGYPLDMTYYQAIKGITAASHVVKPGGRILLIAECTDGAPVTIDQWQLEKLALAAERAELLFYAPGVPPSFRDCLWGRWFGSTAEAVSAAFCTLPPRARVAIIPEGPYVLARALQPVLT
jgi:hypothetical protein